jgi:carbon-monoxide dehydrogenase medium subunit
VSDEGALRIGATATHRQIGRSPLVRTGWPTLAYIEQQVANIRVRTVGTLGGNLCFADPHSDPATWLLVADATVELARGAARRTMPVAEFLRGPWETALDPGELLVAVSVPPLPGRVGMAHMRFATHERPTATVSCMVRVADGAIVEARVAVGSVGPRHVRVPAAEELLVGVRAADPDTATLDAAGSLAASAADPDTDSNGSAEYKADLVRVLVGRGVHKALAAAEVRA